MKTDQDRTPSDTIMENIAAYDVLEREGFSEVVINRIVRAVNNYEALLDVAKLVLADRNFRVHCTEDVQAFLKKAIAQAEGGAK